MDKKCPICFKLIKVSCAGTGNYYCPTCNEIWEPQHCLTPTMLDRVSASVEELAKHLIYYHYGKYHSTVVTDIESYDWNVIYKANVEFLNKEDQLNNKYNIGQKVWFCVCDQSINDTITNVYIKDGTIMYRFDRFRDIPECHVGCTKKEAIQNYGKSMVSKYDILISKYKQIEKTGKLPNE